MSAVANLPTNQQSIQSGQAEPSAQFTPSEEGSCRNPKHVIPAWSDIKERFTSIKGFHAACEVVPQIDQGMFDRLVDAIQRDGQLEKIKVDRDGLVLDGRSRLYACYILSLEPSLEITETDPWVYARANFARRHLTTGQRAILASKLFSQEALLARQRRSAGLKRGNTQPVRQNPDERRGRADEIAAAQCGVSRQSVHIANRLPEPLKEKVAKGELSLNKAAASAGVVKPKTKSAKTCPPAPAHPLSGELPAGVEIAYDGSSVIVVRNPLTQAEAFIYGPNEEKWLVGTAASKIRWIATSRDRAIFSAANLVKSKVAKTGD